MMINIEAPKGAFSVLCYIIDYLFVVSHFTFWKPIIILLLCFDISKSSSLILDFMPDPRIYCILQNAKKIRFVM